MKRVLIVTGGGRGIGAAVARQGAAQGMSVCINYVSDDDVARRLAEELKKQTHVLVHKSDVGDPQSVEALFAAVDVELGPVTDLVNNAGIVGSSGPLTDIDIEKTRRLFNVNLLGPMLCARQAVMRMSTARGGGGGNIVNVSSAAAIHGGPGRYIDYAVSKGGLETFTHSLAKEVARDGIRVNCVRPGFTRTEMNERYMIDDPGWSAEFLKRIPMGRSCSVDEMAAAIHVFLSNNTSYATGAVLDVTGGFTSP